MFRQGIFPWKSKIIPIVRVRVAHIVLFAFLLLLQSCVTSIVRESIQETKFSLIGASGNALSPGEKYEAKLEVQTRQSKEWISRIDWNEIKIESPDGSLKINQQNKIETPNFTFSLIENPTYHLSLSIPGNPYPKSLYEYSVSWALGKKLTFYGNNGYDGRRNENGDNGENGPVIEVEAAYYDVTGTPLEYEGTFILLHCKKNGIVALVRKEDYPLVIIAAGGKGGSGSDGDSKKLQGDEDRVFGERGYDGGNGGSGGVIHLVLPKGGEGIRRLFDLRVPGGLGGNGGRGGSGDEKNKQPGAIGALNAILGVNHGPSGRSGRDGQNGYTDEQALPLERMFLDLNDINFDRTRLRVDENY